MHIINWEPKYDEFQKLFPTEIVLRILISLYQMENRQGSAADISSILDIHISTAKKYLDLLHDCGLLVKEIASNKPGKPTYFTLLSSKINVTLDLDVLSDYLEKNRSIPNILIREKKDLYPRISFILSDDDQIEIIKIKKQTKAQHTITYQYYLSKDESLFMKFLPHPTMNPQPFLNICKRAGILGYIQKKVVYNFIRKLIDLDIIEKFSL